MTKFNPDIRFYKAINAESMFFEAAIFLQMLELNEIFNTTKANKINVTINTDAKTATISATIPIDFRTSGEGTSVIVATEYLATPNNLPLNNQLEAS